MFSIVRFRLVHLLSVPLALMIFLSGFAAFANETGLLKPDFYFWKEKSDPNIATIRHLLDIADTHILCKDVDKLKLAGDDGNWLSRNEIEHCIVPTDRSVLAIVMACGGEGNLQKQFPCPLKMDPERVKLMKQVHQDLKPFIKRLNFDRVIVIANASNEITYGVLVIADEKMSQE